MWRSLDLWLRGWVERWLYVSPDLYPDPVARWQARTLAAISLMHLALGMSIGLTGIVASARFRQQALLVMPPFCAVFGGLLYLAKRVPNGVQRYGWPIIPVFAIFGLMQPLQSYGVMSHAVHSQVMNWRSTPRRP